MSFIWSFLNCLCHRTISAALKTVNTKPAFTGNNQLTDQQSDVSRTIHVCLCFVINVVIYVVIYVVSFMLSFMWCHLCCHVSHGMRRIQMHPLIFVCHLHVF